METATAMVTAAKVTDDIVAAYQADGAVCLRGVFAQWVETLAAGVDDNIAHPGPFAADNLTSGETGRFFDDYCNWQRIAPFETVIRNSDAAEIAAAIMQSRTAQFFHEHVLVKEPGTSKPTPWHQDLPYYFVEGRQCVSFWVTLDAVDDATLRFIAGSHNWPKLVRPTRWLDESRFYENDDNYIDLPDPEADPEKYRILEWQMQPGDAVLFDFRTVHGARANMTERRRRAFSMRWLGDDMVYAQRPGRTSPPFPGHTMGEGQRLREDWFPVLWRAD